MNIQIREVKTQFGPAADRVLGAEMMDDASRVVMNEDDLARGITVALSVRVFTSTSDMCLML